jgi:DNA-binding response OmpR family regulator
VVALAVLAIFFWREYSREVRRASQRVSFVNQVSHELTRQGLAEVLDSEGYQVIQAADGATAIEQFRSNLQDFVCLDIMMPGRSGYDVCRSIQTTHPDLSIIFISAKPEEIDKVVGFELGADDFIVKPFGVREVVAWIQPHRL